MSKAQATRAGRAFVELFTDNTKLEKGLRAAEARVRAFGAHISSMGRKLLAIGAAALAPFGIATKFASDAVEVGNRFDQVFGKMADAANEYAETTANAVGRSVTTLKDSMSSFQSLFKGIGFDDEKAFELTRQMQSLSLDFGSFNNLKDDDAIGRFISGLSGSSEVFDRFGINIKQAALQQELLAQGITKSWAEVSEQEKIAARIGIITKSLGKQGAIGDAVRTSGEFAGQTKRWGGTLKEIWIWIGKAVLPTATEYVRKLNIIGKSVLNVIKNNQGMVLSVARVAAAIAGSGAALLTAGMVIKGMSLLFRPLSAVLTTTISTFKLLGVVLTSLSSPVVLITAGAGVAIAALSGMTDVGRQVMQAFGDIFRNIGTGIHSAMGTIADAVANGRLDIAFKVAWAAIKLSFAELLTSLKTMFIEFKTWWDSLVTKIAHVFAHTWQEKKVDLVADQKKEAVAEEDALHRMNTGKVEQEHKQGKISKQEMYQQLANLEEIHEANLDAIDEEYRTRLDKEREALSDIDAIATGELEDIQSKGNKKKSALEQELAGLRSEFDSELFAAERNLEDLKLGMEASKIEMPDMPSMDELSKQMNFKLNNTNVTGTFNARAAGGLGANALEKIKSDTGKIADATKNIEQNTKVGNNNLNFVP